MEVIFIFVGLAVAFVVVMIVAKNKALADYSASLEQLKKDPHNPDLREATLKLGRTYAALAKWGSQNKSGVFDEVALMNDINAACARAGSRVTVHGAALPSVEDRLAKLDSLYSKKVITDQEYQAKRQQILSDI